MNDPEDGFLDVDALTYASVPETAGELAVAFTRRFLDRFFETSKLSAKRRTQAAEMLRLDSAHEPSGRRILRVEFPFMGSTTWHEWDGTEAQAIEIADETGALLGHDVGHDQASGPTGWEPEFDVEP